MGLGRGRLLALAAHKSTSVRLAGIVDPNQQRLQSVGAECDLSTAQMFGSLGDALSRAKADILVVATPTPLHTQHVIAGLSAGLHVLCEKPLAVSRQDAQQMRDAAH